MEANDLTRQLLISGGVWDVRLICGPDNYDQIKQLIRQRLQAAKSKCIFTGVKQL